VTQLSRLTDDLLDVARINAGKVGLKPAKFDLAALLRQCLSDRRQRFATAELTLKQEIPPASVWLTGDAARLTQAIGNVLDNAIKFTPAGGTVTVRLAADAAARTATLDITDTGVGIPQPLLPHVFESFIQADTSLDRTAGGLGLGLAVAHGLVTLHHGTITAHSDGPGHGSQFTITLPGLQSSTAAAPEKPKNGNGHLHVLIIEDNRDAANTMQRVLKVCGYRTSVAYDGNEGVAMARSVKPDVILCDIGLPEMDGYAVAKTLRTDADTAKARLIAVTGYGTAEDREKSREAGFDSHMVKPVDLNALLGQIQNNHVAA
jgi:CheY-like chemotaxis protein